MHFNTILSYATLAVAVLSAPLTASLTTRSTETWTIPTMDVHFMGRDTGIPGNTWPEDRKFNTTLDFMVVFPTFERQCSANWTYQQVPTTKQSCGDNVTFQLSPTPAGTLLDSTWTLTIQQQDIDSVLLASQIIESNNPGAPNSYLSCVGGAPYDGIRCKLNGWAGKPGPILLDATST